MLADLDTPLDHVVALEAARDVLLERMKKRAAEQGRADDTPEAIAKRLETYEKETAPLLDIYEARGCSSWSTASATSTRSAAVSSATSSSRFGSPGNKPE